MYKTTNLPKFFDIYFLGNSHRGEDLYKMDAKQVDSNSTRRRNTGAAIRIVNVALEDRTAVTSRRAPDWEIARKEKKNIKAERYIKR
ncbi:hypothetical protein JTE90_009713 [Oedothorax gibbosus]|uniref:Uncharacterized protein n=1 Tax=Oedothorax gibbosus TaxID=931172 RepID=A0AAV6V7L5_9ARAC|nr:hypothetical protein JTE90_009713 [Oedothorax gibbosus]